MPMEVPTGWTATDHGLVRELSFVDFKEAFGFLEKVAQLAETAQHHPEVWNSYNKVRLTLFTHDVGAITEKDESLARAINELL